MLHRLGYRFRIHRKDLPGKPDIVLPKYKTVIFIHGCFWHGHRGCKRSKLPASHPDFWKNKIEANIKRDCEARSELIAKGWNVVTIWQCQIRSQLDLAKIIEGLPMNNSSIASI